jgi:hypothetical protein
MHGFQFTISQLAAPTPRRFGMDAELCRREQLAAVLGGVGVGWGIRPATRFGIAMPLYLILPITRPEVRLLHLCCLQEQTA